VRRTSRVAFAMQIVGEGQAAAVTVLPWGCGFCHCHDVLPAASTWVAEVVTTVATAQTVVMRRSLDVQLMSAALC